LDSLHFSLGQAPRPNPSSSYSAKTFHAAGQVVPLPESVMLTPQSHPATVEKL